MTDAPVRQRTSSDVVSWRRDGFVAPKQPMDSDLVDELADASQLVRGDGVDGASDWHVDLTGVTDSARTAESLLATLVDTAHRLTGEPAEVTVAHVVDAGGDRAGLPARQLVHEPRVPDLSATCVILVGREPSTCLVEVSPGRHHDVLICDDDGLLPQSAERALTWRSIELSVGMPIWIHPLAPFRVRPVAVASSATLVLMHLARAIVPGEFVGAGEVITGGFVAPPPITSLAPTTAAAVADAIVQLYDTRGATPYLNGVDHGTHALQAGAHAMAAGASVAMIVAAFLHDIGLLIGVDPRQLTGSPAGGSTSPATDHGVLGAALLERWFTSDVTRPIRLHVAAQRYLAAVATDLDEPSSFGAAANLSGAGPVGEPMSPAEMLAFEATDGWLDALRLRHWDAAAVDPGAPTPSLDTFRTLIESVAVVERSQR